MSLYFKLYRRTILLCKLNLELIKVLDYVWESNDYFACLISHTNYLYRCQYWNQPSMIVPWTLIFWISKVSMFQLFKFLFYFFKWYTVFYLFPNFLVNYWHKLSPVIPSWIVWKVFLNNLMSHFTFFLKQIDLSFMYFILSIRLSCHFAIWC